MSRFILGVDLETTGLDHRTNEIIQIGAILLDTELREVSEYMSLVRPRWPERGVRDDFNVYDYTGISRAVLAPERLFHIVVKEFETWILSSISPKNLAESPSRSLLQDVTLFGQNVAFDAGMLKAEYSRIGMQYPFDFHTLNLESFYVFHNFITGGKLPRSLHLKAIASACSISNAKAHDAVEDIRTTVACARKLIGEHKGSGG